ncbi:phage/plasmid primase, P4 family [Aminirod propionatiphilus]|uniref:phage/plasmid primase, P4 family n=1 Tax=Aminirod propionatiphilus TaxID=3415223 RepID=UPI003BFA6A42
MFQVVRIDGGPDGKKIWQRRPDGDGWANNMQGIRPVPYRLPELLRAIEAGETIYVAEGEKCVGRLVSVGLTATCNHGGAGKWKPLHAKWFPAGTNVVILPDSDVPGTTHAQQVQQSLRARGCLVKIVNLGYAETAKHGKDIYDWFEEGHSKEELLSLAAPDPLSSPDRQVEELREGPEDPEDEDLDVQARHLTDIGNAERFVRLHGQDVRYVHAWKRWLTWDGKRWNENAPFLVMRKAIETVRGMYRDVADIYEDKERKEMLEHVKQSERKGRLDAMIALAHDLEGIPVAPEELDSNPWLVNCLNGTLDLQRGKVYRHRRENLLTKLIPVPFEPDAICPRWESFLGQIMNGDDELISFLQRTIGYSLTGSTEEHCLFVLYGTGRNGKSTFLNTVKALFADYGRQTAADTFMAKKNSGGPGDDVAALRGARFVTAIETEENQRLAEAMMKQLTGGDTILVRRLYENYFEYRPEFKVFLATNHKPSIRGTDHAIWKRIRLIPFTVTISEEEKDTELPQKLLAELPGIFAWAVRGCMAWKRNGLGVPEKILEATDAYRSEMDILGGFLSDCCCVKKAARTLSQAIYVEYCRWCEEVGEKPVTQRNLGNRLKERGFEACKGGKGQRYWKGIGLLDNSGRAFDDNKDNILEFSYSLSGADGANREAVPPMSGAEVGIPSQCPSAQVAQSGAEIPIPRNFSYRPPTRESFLKIDHPAPLAPPIPQQSWDFEDDPEEREAIQREPEGS